MFRNALHLKIDWLVDVYDCLSVYMYMLHVHAYGDQKRASYPLEQ